MTPEEREYVRYRMAQAREALEDARILFQRERLRGSVNRLYYACFYAATAVLYCSGLSSSKHKGVLTLFDKHLVQSGRFRGDMGRFLHRLFDHRQTGDYGKHVVFEHDDVEGWLTEAERFVSAIAEEMDSRGCGANPRNGQTMTGMPESGEGRS